ncbi:FlgD immunoglobulin-like domain containing protein [Elusimicrobiota bacterium]
MSMFRRAITFFFISIFFFYFSFFTSAHAQTRKSAIRQAFTALSDQNSDWKIRQNPANGSVESLIGGKTLQQPNKDAEAVAREFLGSEFFEFGSSGKGTMRLTSVSPDNNAQYRALELNTKKESDGGTHLLFDPTYKGIPIEHAPVSVHLTNRNEIYAVFSSYDEGVETPGLDTTPKLSAQEARSQANTSREADAWLINAVKNLKSVAGELVILPPASSAGTAHLAWKFRFRWSEPFGLWSVYLDAHTGEILLKINELRFTSQTISTQMSHWKLDPDEINWSTSPARGLYVFETYLDAGTLVIVSTSITNASGSVATHTGSTLYATTLTTYAVVSNENGNQYVYSEGDRGIHYSWTTQSISSSSVSPYPVNTIEEKDFACQQNTVFNLFRFNPFDLGYLDTDGSSQDDMDYVEHLRPGDKQKLSLYFGNNKTNFMTYPTTGSVSTLRLVSNSYDGAGNEGGYRINLSSCMVYIAGDPAVGSPACSDGTADCVEMAVQGSNNKFAAINALKHMDTIYKRLTDANAAWSTTLSSPVVMHINFGSEYANAFFEPDLDALFMGAGGSFNSYRNLALAADVVTHEYVHWAVDKIYELPNFGHAGAISEAIADFFALEALANEYSSLERSTFGEWAFPAGTCGAQNSACRDISNTKKYPGNWVGEIHDDSQILSGALWDLRAAIGSTETKKLVQQALFYFPDSFPSFYEAMTLASGALYGSAYTTQIDAAFNAHGIGTWPGTWSGASGDSLEPNDGYNQATAIASGETKTATLYPGGDVDFFRITAGKGDVSLSLARPYDSQWLMHLGYGFQVFNVDRQLIASAMPETVIELGNSYVGDSEKTASLKLSLDSPQVLYVAVSAPLTLDGNNDSSNSSSAQYAFSSTYAKPIRMLSATRMSASQASAGKYLIKAQGVTGFKIDQSTEATFSRLDVLDHSFTKLDMASGAYLTTTVNKELPGDIEVQAELPANFKVRYPSVGSIYFEMFVVVPLDENNPTKARSVGITSEIKVQSAQSDIVAYNGLFNPLRGEKTTIKYQSGSAGHYKISIYTIAGDLVKTLVNRNEESGVSSIDWDGKNGRGETVASGVYFVHLEGPGIRKTKKVVVVK